MNLYWSNTIYYNIPIILIHIYDYRRTRNVARDYLAGIRALFGGELTTYTTLMAEAREEAIQRMIHDAIISGANGIVSVRITTNNLASNASELMAYGMNTIHTYHCMQHIQ